jgi:outer membrane protein OmpA-like peptidoglycan-associated protein
MRPFAAALLAVIAAGCATDRAADAAAAPQGPGSMLKSAELARVRCLLVAPFENGSDAPLAAEAATGAVLSGIDGARTKVFPISDLRAIFRDTPLDLPQGLPPSLALELGELLGADAALWGSIEGRGKDGGELLVTIRLSLVADHQLLFADTALVRPGPGEKAEASVRRAALDAVGPMLARLGDPGHKRCFEPDRIRSLRRFALAETPEARAAATAAPPTAPKVASAAPARSAAAAPPPAPEPRTPRQADWAKRLAAGGRVLVDDVSFAGRSAELQRDAGLADLAGALQAQPTLTVRIEGFVDGTSDRAADAKLSTAMAQAAAKRLSELGVPKQRVTSAGRGGESPILPNFTARGRSANRRIEAVAVK